MAGTGVRAFTGTFVPRASPDRSASSGAVDAPPWSSRRLPPAYDLAIPLRVVRGPGRERMTTAVHRDPAKPEMGGRHHLCRDSGGVAVCGGAVRFVFSPGRGLGYGGTHHDRVDTRGTHDGRVPAAGRAAVAPSLGSRQPIYGGTIPAGAHTVRLAVFHEPTGELLGQCRRGELLCKLENRAGLSSTVSEPAGGTDGHFCLQRRIL